ncbi:MAG: PBP1A family penicillin-binding protein [Clostridia bacterium]|nr:PBP1A family penicillin-binding protein [Clostridia bacterium]
MKKSRKNLTFGKLFWTALKAIFKVLIPVAFFVGIALVIFIIAAAEPIDVDDLRLDLTSSICYLNEDGKVMEFETISGSTNRFWVEYDKVPQHMKDAFISIEDERFLSHKGFDIKRTTKAVFDYFRVGSKAQGGSTITQQLVKNLTNNQKRTPIRKIQEIWIAYQLERQLTKDQILELYMNTIYLAQGVNGVQTASQLYFDKDVSELSLAQCASIAGITQYPSYYDPFLQPENNKNKQEVVLRKMLELGKISQEEHDQAVAEKLDFKKGNMKVTVSSQSYMAETVISDAIDLLVNEKGISETIAKKKILSGGYQIISTVDPKVQAAIDKVFKDPSNFPSSPYSEYPQGAIVVMDPQTGHIKGLYGGIGPKPGLYSLNRAIATTRQPGSCIKPIAVYAPAVEEGLITPNTLYTDQKVSYGSWSPKNYYSGFRGSMTVQQAVAQSVNTIPVQILDSLGVDKSYKFLKNKMHISSLVEEDKGLAALALGGMTNGISVKEITAAYATFGNNGVYTEPVTILEIRDSYGKPVVKVTPETTVAMSEKTASAMHQMLCSVINYGTGTAARISGVQAGGKTGTTDEDKDRWFVGYTPNYVAAVWYGFDTPKGMDYVSGNPALNAWKKVIGPLMETAPEREYTTKSTGKYYYSEPKPDTDDVKVSVCSFSGLLPVQYCYDTKTVTVSSFPPDQQPTLYCSEEIHLNPDANSGEVTTPDESGNSGTVPPVSGEPTAPTEPIATPMAEPTDAPVTDPVTPPVSDPAVVAPAA